MNPLCTNCLHWGDDLIDEETGLAMCHDKSRAHVNEEGKWALTVIRTRGDEFCAHHMLRCVPHVGDTHDAQTTSEADKP